MAVFLKERGVVAARLETTKGTANAPAAVDGGTEVSDVVYSADIAVMERDPVRASFDREKNITGNRSARLSFKTPLIGGSSAGSRPNVWAMLRACGYSESISAGVSVTYTPLTASASQETATIDFYADGILYRIVGAMGNVTLDVKENEVPMLSFEFTGVYVAPTDTALITPTYSGVSPPSPLSATLTFRSTTMVATGFSFNTGNEVVLREDITNAAGLIHAVIVNRDPTITCDPELETVATFDFLTNLVNATAGEFNGQIGTAAGNTFRANFPNSQITEAPLADRGGRLTHNLTLKPRRLASAGNDFGTLRWT